MRDRYPPMSYSDADKAAYYKAKYLASQKRTRPYRAPAPSRKPRAAPAAPRRARAPKNPRSDLYGAGAEAVGSTIGAAVGGPPGALLGGVLGRGAHALFKAITGFGDYRVEHNTLMLGGMSPPEIVNSANRGSVIIRHREYLGDVLATTAFTLQQYPINPGQQLTFPWLSQVAESFEEYRLRGAIFEFKSLSSDAVLSSATSSALGSVIMATQYDVLDAPFLNKMEMENYEFANSSKPSCTFYHPIECKKSLTPGGGELYVRNSAVPANADARLYDLGTFSIATVGMQADSGVAGELWCTFEVELFKPKFNSNWEGSVDHFWLQGSFGPTYPLGSLTPVLAPGSSLGCRVNVLEKTVYFPKGIRAGSKFLVTWLSDGSSSVTIVSPVVTPNNCAIIPFWSNGTYSIMEAPAAGSTGHSFIQTFVVTITENTTEDNTWISWSGGTFGNGTYVKDLIIEQVNDALH